MFPINSPFRERNFKTELVILFQMGVIKFFCLLRRIIPIDECVVWDGTNIPEIRESGIQWIEATRMGRLIFKSSRGPLLAETGDSIFKDASGDFYIPSKVSVNRPSLIH
jgi:hypothetical protein